MRFRQMLTDGRCRQCQAVLNVRAGVLDHNEGCPVVMLPLPYHIRPAEYETAREILREQEQAVEHLRTAMDRAESLRDKLLSKAQQQEYPPLLAQVMEALRYAADTYGQPESPRRMWVCIEHGYRGWRPCTSPEHRAEPG